MDLCQCNLHDNHIHKCNTVEIPLLTVGFNQLTVLLFIKDGIVKQLQCKLTVFVVFKHWQKALILPIFLRKLPDGFHYESLYNFNIIVPENTFIFQNFFQFFVVEDKLLKDFSPKLPVVVVIRFCFVGIFSINIGCDDFVEQVLYKRIMFSPRHGALI